MKHHHGVLVRTLMITIPLVAQPFSLSAENLPLTFVQAAHLSGDQARFTQDTSGVDHNGKTISISSGVPKTWAQMDKLQWTRLLSETWDGGEIAVTNLETAASRTDFRGLSTAFKTVSQERGRPYYGYFDIPRLPGFFFPADINSQPSNYRSQALLSDGNPITRYPEHRWHTSSFIGFTGNDLDVTNPAAVQQVLANLNDVFRSNCVNPSDCVGPLHGFIFLNEMKLSRHWTADPDDPQRQNLAPSNPAHYTCDIGSTASPAPGVVIPKTSSEVQACRKANYLPWQAGHFHDLRGDSDPKWSFLNPPKRTIPLFSQLARDHFVAYANSVGASTVASLAKLPADRDEFNISCAAIATAPALPHPSGCLAAGNDCSPWPVTTPSTWASAGCTDPETNLPSWVGFFPPGHEIWSVWEDWVFETWTGFLRDVSDTIHEAQCGVTSICGNPDYQGVMYFRAPESYAIRAAASEPLTFQYFDINGELQTETIVLADQPHFDVYSSPVYGVDLELLFDSPAVTGVIHETSSAIHTADLQLGSSTGIARDEKIIFPAPGRPEYFKHYHIAKGFLAKRVAHQRGKLFGAFARAHYFWRDGLDPADYPDAWDRSIQILQPDVIGTISPRTYLSSSDSRGIPAYQSFLGGYSGDLRAPWLAKLAAIADPTAGTLVVVDTSQSSFVRADGAGNAQISPTSAVTQTTWGFPDGIDNLWNAEDGMVGGGFSGWGAISSHARYENAPPLTMNLLQLPNGVEFDVYARYILESSGTPGNTEFGLSLGTAANRLTAYAENYPGHRTLRELSNRTEVETYLGRVTSSAGSVSLFADDDDIGTLAVWTGARFVNNAGGSTPIANFTYSCSGLTCTFDGGLSSDDLGISVYSWNFGDDSVLTVGTAATHVFPATGPYSVTLTVRDTSGLVGVRTHLVSPGLVLPGKATNPSPAMGATGVSENPMLNWSGDAGATFRMHFGGCSSPPFINTVTPPFSPGSLSPGTEYCWRVDSVNNAGTTLGDLWRFTTAVSISAQSGCDFNGDGRSDLAVGAPGETIGSLAGGGAVTILYGSSTGPTGVGSQEWHQNIAGIDGAAEAADDFGSAVACGDFDGDGYSDLAVGVPGEAIGSVAAAGAIHVIFGSAAGLSSTADQLWYQSLSAVRDLSETNDAFGAALAAGDFDGDGFADLAVGVPGENVGGAAGAGGVQVFYGTSSGLSASRDLFYTQNNSNLPDAAEIGDNFGAALTTGDFDGDGFYDLAIGSPGETLLSLPGAGTIHVIYGTSGGLKGTGAQMWNQGSPGIAETSEAGDAFGQALAAGDVDGDGRDDLVIGVPGESVGSLAAAGAFHVLYGSSGSGLIAVGSQYWHQNSPGVAGGAEAGDQVGAALAVGDFNNDGISDVAIGAPGEAIGSLAEAGAAHVMLGSVSGLTTTGSKLYYQDTAAVRNVSEAGDRFANALGIGDFNGDGHDDLAIGVPFEGLGGVPDAGAVHILFGASGGTTTSGNQVWHQGAPGVVGTIESTDLFGFSLAQDKN